MAQEAQRRGFNILGIETAQAQGEAVTAELQRLSQSAVAAGGQLFDYTRESNKIKEKAFDRANELALINNPVRWIEARNADLTKIENDAARVAEEAYRRYLTVYEYAPDEAKRMAIAHGDASYEVALKEHQLKYPDSEYKMAKERRLKFSPGQ